jgi:hypothetical protein
MIQNKAISQHKYRKVTRYVKLYALGLCFPFAKPVCVTSIQSDAFCGSSYADTKFKPDQQKLTLMGFSTIVSDKHIIFTSTYM